MLSKHIALPSALANQRTANRYQLQRATKPLLFKDVGNHFPRYLTDPLEHQRRATPLLASERATKPLLFKDVGNHFPKYLTDPLWNTPAWHAAAAQPVNCPINHGIQRRYCRTHPTQSTGPLSMKLSLAAPHCGHRKSTPKNLNSRPAAGKSA